MAKNELPEGVEPFWNREQAAKYLNVHPDTLRRLIKEYRLPASKIGKEWRFRLIDLQIYMAERSTIRGLIAVKPYVFQEAVLDKYPSAPGGKTEKYYRRDDGHSGEVGNRRDWHDWKSGKSPEATLKQLSRPASGGKLTKDDFVDVFYNKIRLKDGQVVIVVQADELERIPPLELKDWYRFKIKNPASLPWPW